MGYGRVSRVGGRTGASFISPELQRDGMHRNAYGRGHILVDVIIDLDESGGNMKRPGWFEVMERAKGGEVDGIIVPKLDRFSRNLKEALETIEELDELGIPLISVAEDFDPTTAMGRFVRDFVIRIAQLEREKHAEVFEDVRKKAVGRGVHIASRTPTGYTRDPETRRLLLDDHSWEAVREVFLRRADGASLRDCAAILNRLGIRGPYDSPHWTTSSIAKLLANRVYTGQARSGEHVLEDAHPAIVSPEEWEATQIVRPLPASRSGAGPLLSGLLRCAGCRYLMKPDKMKRRDGNGKMGTYRCRGEHAAGRCLARASTLAHVIEPYIVDRFFELQEREIAFRATLSDSGVDEIRARLERAKSALAAWRRNMTPADDAPQAEWEFFKAGAAERIEAAKAIELELEAAIAASRGARGPEETLALRNVWDELAVEDRRALLASALDAVVLRGGRQRSISERVHLIERGRLPDGFPRRGKRLEKITPFAWPDGDEVEARMPAL